MITITRHHTFSAAHRLYHYTGQCEQLHGHNYDVDIRLSCDANDALDAQGMVLDFAQMKSVLCAALDRMWDHKTLLYDRDPLAKSLANLLQDDSVCSVPFNPTAENMATYLGREFFPRILQQAGISHLIVLAVTVFETANNSATWEKTDGNALYQ
ncbi:MAG: 6-carboxytetrahydropterin synthase [Desulfovibrio sp.]|nr:6-carboxytetrahydropterin synthase [Desulfovibrio sp.]